ncbi:MAG TPA: efflux RND transporter periplasmic adaptor subunit [Gammaproteobacteria bacterium]
MKRFILILLAGALAACGDAEHAGAEREAEFIEHAQKHMDATYVCPMHPDVMSDEPGNCPICGMRLVKKETPPPAEAGESGEREVLYYRHPHNPQVTSPVPAKDEMGMDFVPVYADESVSESATITIDPVIVQNLGVRTAAAERGRLWRRIDTVGYVQFDGESLRHIHPRASGWVEELAVHAVGERIEQGEVLFTFYSPDIVSAQEEFIGALRTGNARLVAASRERLRAFGVAAQDIARIAETRKVIREIPYYAPRDEVVAELNVREGMYIEPGVEAMVLADLSRVWVVADVFAAQAEWLREGQPAEVRLDYLPGRQWEGDVRFISPVVDPQTRTVQVRLAFANPDALFKPNMFADVTIYGGAKRDIVFIPHEALIRTGEGAHVILALGEGRFASRDVVPGMASGDYVEIIRGIEAGERVVTSGQFLIDSEASLRASLRRLESDAKPASPAHDGHDMENMQ